ncbi:MAG: hypothetical protein ABW116_16460 [Candidatus Sedimenticola sp. 20ELBAFRAG]
MKQSYITYRYLLAILIGSLGLCSVDVMAAVTGVTVNSVSPSRAALGAPTTVTVRWTVTGTGPVVAAAPPTTVRSTGGSFQDTEDAPTVILGSTSKSLAATVAGATYSVNFTDTLVIPASVTYKAYKNSLTSFVLLRRFSDGYNPGVSQSSAATFTITSSGTLGFNINRQALYFDDGSTLRNLLQDEPLSAVSELRYSGTGLIKGVWELATPATTSGEPVYRRLKSVRQFLGAGGRTKLRSPSLETGQQGLYKVRFRIEDPVTGFDDLVIDYFVGVNTAINKASPVTLELSTPRHGAYLHPDTWFSWQAVANARSYRLELFQKAAAASFPRGMLEAREFDSGKHPGTLNESPVSGAVVPGEKTGVKLSAISQRHLEAGHVYWWRVLAIGDDGAPISQSPLREIRLP